MEAGWSTSQQVLVRRGRAHESRRPQPALRHPGGADGLRGAQRPDRGDARLGPGEIQAAGPDPGRAAGPIPGEATSWSNWSTSTWRLTAATPRRVLRPPTGSLPIRGELGLVADPELQATLDRIPSDTDAAQNGPEGAADPSGRARFLLEAEITGRLEHPRRRARTTGRETADGDDGALRGSSIAPLEVSLRRCPAWRLPDEESLPSG